MSTPSVQTLNPVSLVKNGAGLDVTALLATPTQAILQFSNSGREILIISASGDSDTVTVEIGATVLGRPVTGFDPVTLAAGDLVAFGPFDSQVDQPGGNTVEVSVSAAADVKVALLTVPGAA